MHDYAGLLLQDLVCLQFANLTKEQPAVKVMKVRLNVNLHRNYESYAVELFCCSAGQLFLLKNRAAQGGRMRSTVTAFHAPLDTPKAIDLCICHRCSPLCRLQNLDNTISMKERTPQLHPTTTHLDTFWNLDLRWALFLFETGPIPVHGSGHYAWKDVCFKTSSSSISDLDCKNSPDLGAIILGYPGMQPPRHVNPSTPQRCIKPWKIRQQRWMKSHLMISCNTYSLCYYIVYLYPVSKHDTSSLAVCSFAQSEECEDLMCHFHGCLPCTHNMP